MVAAEPDARELVAGLGEEARADDQKEDDRPGRGETEVLLLMAAERLHLVDVGYLEGERGEHADRRDRGRIMPFEAAARDDVGGIERGPDQHGERQLGDANNAGE